MKLKEWKEPRMNRVYVYNLGELATIVTAAAFLGVGVTMALLALDGWLSALKTAGFLGSFSAALEDLALLLLGAVISLGSGYVLCRIQGETDDHLLGEDLGALAPSAEEVDPIR